VKNLDPKRARWIRTRMGVLCGVMGLALGGIVSSAWRVQVEDGPEWREIAEKQRQRRLHVEPKRGTIYDRNGTPLAVSIEVPSVSADVAEMLHGVEGKAAQDATLRDASLRLGQALSIDAAELYAKLSQRHRFVWIKRRVTGDEAAAVRELGDTKIQAHPVRGLSIEGEGHRYYPGRELAGSVLGFVAPDGQGKDGLELALDEDLRGKVEDVRGLRDRSGRLIFEGANDEHALQGNDVTLSIDEGIQHVAERELDAAMRTYETRGGSLVVVDPASGEILALASTPGYNPNDYTDSDADARRDRAVTDRFEPGSAMKTFTIAAALNAGALKPNDPIDCEHGIYQVAGITVHDTHLNDVLTPTQILARSSNIGALKIGLQLGEPALYAAFRRFGFGEDTGVPLPGEAAGVLRPKGRPWVDAETATASFGQGVTVTTLQLAMAMGAIANGGKLLEPILVKRVSGGRGDTIREASVHVRREVVSPGVARTVAEMLTAVTEKEEGGTAVEAAVPGFRIAGKTSTAQKVDPGTGKYSNEKYTSVFVGFVPVERPRLVVAVVLDEPTVGHYGGELAGPVFRRVAEASLRYLGVTPSASTAKIAAVKREGDPADATLAMMRPPTPPAAPPTPPPAVVASAAPPGTVRVPDASGLPAHDVVTALTKAGLVPQIEGWGRAVRQNPAPGAAAPKGSAVRVVLEPAS
jgi:cell division protein FtsI (penicillin-binding protein 3)